MSNISRNQTTITVRPRLVNSQKTSILLVCSLFAVRRFICIYLTGIILINQKKKTTVNEPEFHTEVQILRHFILVRVDQFNHPEPLSGHVICLCHWTQMLLVSKVTADPAEPSLLMVRRYASSHQAKTRQGS